MTTLTNYVSPLPRTGSWTITPWAIIPRKTTQGQLPPEITLGELPPEDNSPPRTTTPVGQLSPRTITPGELPPEDN